MKEANYIDETFDFEDLDDIEFEERPVAPWYDVPDPQTEWKEFHGNVLEVYLTPKCMYYNAENSSWQMDGVQV